MVRTRTLMTAVIGVISTIIASAGLVYFWLSPPLVAGREGPFQLVVWLRHTGAGRTVWSPDGKLLATASDGLLRIWDTRKWDIQQEIPLLQMLSYPVMAFSTNSQFLAISHLLEWNWENYSHSFSVIDVNNGKVEKKTQGPFLSRTNPNQNQPYILATQEPCDTIAVRYRANIGVEGEPVGFYSRDSWQQTSFLKSNYSSPIASISISPDCRSIAISHTAWRRNSGENLNPAALAVLSSEAGDIELYQAEPHGRFEASAMAWSPDARFLATSGGAYPFREQVGSQMVEHEVNRGVAPIQIWDVATKQRAATITGDFYGATSLSFSSDGRWLAAAVIDRPFEKGFSSFRVWDTNKLQQVQKIKWDCASPQSVSFSPDSKHLALFCAGHGGLTQLLKSAAFHSQTVAIFSLHEAALKLGALSW